MSRNMLNFDSEGGFFQVGVNSGQERKSGLREEKKGENLRYFVGFFRVGLMEIKRINKSYMK